MWQVTIHVAFLLSAIAMAYVDRLTSHHPAVAAIDNDHHNETANGR